MSDINISIPGGESKRLLTGGKYCPDNIVVTAEGVAGVEYIEITVTTNLTNADAVYDFLRSCVPQSAKAAFFYCDIEMANAVNNQLLSANLNLLVENSAYTLRMSYYRWRDSKINAQLESYSTYDLFLTPGDVLRLVVLL